MVLPERKQWVQEAVEAQWNARTVMQFVGFHDCAPNDPADVQIQPVSSGSVVKCLGGDDTGAYCVEDLGTRSKGKRVFLNLLFGDETVYRGRYLQSVTQATYNPSLDVAVNVWIPAACGDQAQAVLDNPSMSTIGTFNLIYKQCLQNVSVHEFGHLAGFSHEQYRQDVSAACRAQEGAPPTDAESLADEDLPLGVFDTESIMSYCRKTLQPNLTDEDVTQTNDVYNRLAVKLPPSVTKPSADTTAKAEGGPSGSNPANKASNSSKSKKSASQAADDTETSGGCNVSGHR